MLTGGAAPCTIRLAGPGRPLGGRNGLQTEQDEQAEEPPSVLFDGGGEPRASQERREGFWGDAGRHPALTDALLLPAARVARSLSGGER